MQQESWQETGDNIRRELDENIPSHAITKNSSSSQSSWTVTSGYAVTICCSGDSSALLLNSKSPRARDKARLPLTRPKSTKPPAALIRAFSPIIQITEVRNKKTEPGERSPQTFVLWLVVKRKGLCAALDTQNRARVTCIGLIPGSMSVNEDFQDDSLISFNIGAQACLIRTTQILCFEMTLTAAVQPDTSNSYFGSTRVSHQGEIYG